MFKRIGEFFKKISRKCAEFMKFIWHYISLFFQKASKHPVWLAITIVSFIVGLLLLILPNSIIIDYVYITLGFAIIVLGFTKIAKFRNGGLINYYEGTLDIVLGALVMFSHHLVTMIIVGLFLVALPIYRIIRSKDKKTIIRHEAVYLGLGFVVLFCGEFFAGAFIIILAIMLLALAGYLGYLLWNQDSSLDRRKKVEIASKKVIEATCEEKPAEASVIDVTIEEEIVDEKEN